MSAMLSKSAEHNGIETAWLAILSTDLSAFRRMNWPNHCPSMPPLQTWMQYNGNNKRQKEMTPTSAHRNHCDSYTGFEIICFYPLMGGTAFGKNASEVPIYLFARKLLGRSAPPNLISNEGLEEILRNVTRNDVSALYSLYISFVPPLYFLVFAADSLGIPFVFPLSFLCTSHVVPF